LQHRDRASRMPMLGAAEAREVRLKFVERLDNPLQRIIHKPGARSMPSRAARDDFQVKNAFFLDGDFIQGAVCRENGHAPADACLLEEKTGPVLPPYFFV